MTTITNKEAALLGLLLEEPMHPYKIEKAVEYRSMRYWTDLSMSSIYKVLAKLEDKGHVTSEMRISDENKPQKVYTITEEGKNAMMKKVRDLISKPEHMKWQVDIGAYNLDILDLKEAGPLLDRYSKELEGLLDGYKKLEEYMGGDECAVWRVSISRRPQYLIKAEMEWVKDLKNRLSNI